MVFRPSKARQNFDESSNRLFSYEDFSYKVVKLFFDQLHHVTTNEVSLIDALELMVFCNHQGQMDMKSEFETRLYQDLSDQILAEIKDSKELCFVWMFLRSRGPSGSDKNGLPLKIIKTVSIDFKQATVKHYNLYHHKPPKVLPKKYWNRLMKMIMIMLYRRLLLAQKRIHMKATTKMILSS